MTSVQLSRREAQVAHLVAKGKSAKAIADHLGISRYTARNYIEAVGKRLPGHGSPRHRITLFVLQLDPPEGAA